MLEKAGMMMMVKFRVYEEVTKKTWQRENNRVHIIEVGALNLEAIVAGFQYPMMIVMTIMIKVMMTIMMKIMTMIMMTIMMKKS